MCEGIFQFCPLGMKLWEKMINFEDHIGLLVLKIIILKNQAILKHFPPPHQKRKRKYTIDMGQKFILQNIIET